MAVALPHRRLSTQKRFLLLALPGAIFIIVFLLLPILSVIVFSFWRTESYTLIPDWNFDNYRVLLGETTYMTFLLRSFLTAFGVSVFSLIYAWPIAYFIAKHGHRY
ncbi:MAG: hypothetical protein ACKVH7_06015, partial [Alphaproteobacteria bacterium]